MVYCRNETSGRIIVIQSRAWRTDAMRVNSYTAQQLTADERIPQSHFLSPIYPT